MAAANTGWTRQVTAISTGNIFRVELNIIFIACSNEQFSSQSWSASHGKLASVIGKIRSEFIFQAHELLAKLFCKIVRIPTKRSQTKENLAASHSNYQTENPRLAKRFVKS
jgi:hypothetical protein